VHWCSQQRGHPGIPLERYGPADLEREFHSRKSCAPFCTVGCVHRVAQVDELRVDPVRTLLSWFEPSPGQLAPKIPLAVRTLSWMFVTSAHRNFFRHVAQRVLGIQSRVESR
jgi:hypothetical protein